MLSLFSHSSILTIGDVGGEVAASGSGQGGGGGGRGRGRENVEGAEEEDDLMDAEEEEEVITLITRLSQVQQTGDKLMLALW